MKSLLNQANCNKNRYVHLNKKKKFKQKIQNNSKGGNGKNLNSKLHPEEQHIRNKSQKIRICKKVTL